VRIPYFCLDGVAGEIVVLNYLETKLDRASYVIDFINLLYYRVKKKLYRNIYQLVMLWG
jgi:hypothetical protein